MSGQIFEGRDLTADVDVSCDVCIVGSGAGGGVLAAELTAAGLNVVMLEAGGYFTRRDFVKLDEAWSISNLYQDRGARATDDRAITILQGRSVGGGTTVNWTTCFRTPDRILKHWETVHGIEGLDSQTLAPHFQAVEERLNIHPWPVDTINANNKVLMDGAKALGLTAHTTRRNVYSCANSGYCGFGCPVNAKQGMLLTTIPDAITAGMRLYADVRAERIETSGDRVVTVHAKVLHRHNSQHTGVKVTVRPKVLAVAGGAINTPALFLRSNINQGPVGHRTWLHPVVAMLARFKEPIRPFYGAPQSAYSHARVDRGDDIGYFLEVAPLHPLMGGTGSTMFGDAQLEQMAQLDHISVPIAICVDGLNPNEAGGTVSVKRDGRIALSYPIGDELKEAFRDAHHWIARIALAAGAEVVHPTHPETSQVIRSEADLGLIDGLTYGGHHHSIFTAHQMGGCTMGPNPATSVVNTEHRHHHLPNLFVVDGSVLPTGLGVNPSETIYGLSHRAASFVGQAV